MRSRVLAVPAGAILFIAVIAVLVYGVPRLSDTRLTFRVQDATSGGWVWNATSAVEGKEMSSYFQSDRGPVDLTFTHLRPGRTTLTVTAPDYIPSSVAVTLHPGLNRLRRPVELTGYRIPDLDHFTMFANVAPDGIEVEVRPVATDGSAITNHPCLDLWIGAVVSSQVPGVESSGGGAAAAARGRAIYRGRVPWRWDPRPEATFRYSALIPSTALGDNRPSHFVIDFLVIVPDPRKIRAGEVESLMQGAPVISDVAGLEHYLDIHNGESKYQYYFSTSWNVGESKAQQ